MKLSKVCDSDLREIAVLKTRKGTATSEAKRAQQILYSRNISRGGYGVGSSEPFASTYEHNSNRDYKSFKEIHGCTLAEYLTFKKRRTTNEEYIIRPEQYSV